MTQTQHGPEPTAEAPASATAPEQPGTPDQQGGAMPELHPVFMKQIECLATGDYGALLETFHPEIVSLRFQGPLYGRKAAGDLLRQYEGLDMEFVGIEEYAHCEDMILTRTKLRVQGEEIVAFGAYVIRDGMIWRQFGADEGGVRDWWGASAASAGEDGAGEDGAGADR